MRQLVMVTLLLAVAGCSAHSEDGPSEGSTAFCGWPCSAFGRCADNGLCSCSAMGECYADGLPVPDEYCCAATSEYDCAVAQGCAMHGMCSLGAGACYAASDADCATSLDCWNLDLCRACPAGYCGTATECGP